MHCQGELKRYVKRSETLLCWRGEWREHRGDRGIERRSNAHALVVVLFNKVIQSFSDTIPVISIFLLL
jgi:hypothetical protein